MVGLCGGARMEVRYLEAHMSQGPSGARCLHSWMQRVCVVVVECGGRVVVLWGHEGCR